MSQACWNAELALGSPVHGVAGLPALVRRQLERICAASARRGERPRPAAPPASEAADWRDVQDSLDGDGEAYARLVRRYQQEIGAYLWRFTRDRGQWEELVQDVFVEAYLSLRTYRGLAPLVHWLRRIATRVGYRWWSQRARDRKQSPAALEDWDRCLADGRAEASSVEAAEVVHAILDRMPVRDRLVLTLLYLEGCSVQEAAALTGWSASMVKVQAFRARKRLLGLLHESGGD